MARSGEVTTMRSDLEDEPPAPSEVYRPALVTMSRDVRGLIDEVRGGLEDEAEVVRWLRRATIATLGELDVKVFSGLSRQFQGGQGVLLAALLVPAPRRRQVSRDVEQAVRERLAARYVLPAYHRAFRELRTDATEYADDAADGDAHDPERQTFTAMRPALDELATWQERALEALLDGFSERGDVLEWAEDLELATHGEIPESFAMRCYHEESTVAVLTGDDPVAARVRRQIAVHHLLPAFRDGVRTLSRRAGEVADAESDTSEVRQL
jgi:hypothetical protein